MSLHIQKVLSKELSRKDFLKYLGVFILTIFGISAFLKNLSSFGSTKKVRQVKTLASKSSFGHGVYGV